MSRQRAMGIPILVGASEKVKRSGATFGATCPACRASAKMHEASVHTNVTAFLAISLWDSERPVVQCGECLAVFGDEDAERLRATATEPPSLLGRLLSRSNAAPASSRSASPASKRPPVDESAIDAELQALKKRLGKA
ncbi:MAG TPA: hypothetical protein PLR99_07165 [Polyangiaceae bacterium]|nr:hypothetical protein [Polyangiaceae bacterium]